MKPYKLAQIYKGKEWHVYYYYHNPEDGKFHRFRVKKGINRIADLKERYTEAKKLRDAINDLLISGQLSHFEDAQDSDITDLGYLPLSNALDWAFSKRSVKLATKTQIDYTSVLKYLKEAITKSGNNYPIIRIKKMHVKSIMEQVIADRTLSAARQNAYLETLKTMFSELIEWDVIESNPAQYVKPVSEPPSTTHEPLTLDELLIVGAHLKKVHFPFYVFTKILLSCLIRPDEILTLKHGDITERDIYLRPANPNSKHKARTAPVHPELWSMVSKLKQPAPGEYYFSLKLQPGAKRIHRNTVTELWKSLVKGKPLYISKTMYSLKHTGVDRMLSAGLSILDAQGAAGHSSSVMTRVYDKHDSEKLMRDERLRKTAPEF